MQALRKGSPARHAVPSTPHEAHLQQQQTDLAAAVAENRALEADLKRYRDQLAQLRGAVSSKKAYQAPEYEERIVGALACSVRRALVVLDLTPFPSPRVPVFVPSTTDRAGKPRRKLHAQAQRGPRTRDRVHGESGTSVLRAGRV